MMRETGPAVSTEARICESDVPLAAVLAAERACLAVIIGVEGPSYRPVGAAMAIDGDGRRTGSLSSGCIDNDVAIHAGEALRDGKPRRLRYGRGSPFLDLQLPCGGGLEIMLLPDPARAPLERAHARLQARNPAQLAVGPGGLAGVLNLVLLPRLRLIVFGKGPEPRALTELARAAAQSVELHSPDDETHGGLPGAHPLTHAEWPPGLALDARSAVMLFFHDHDWEPPFLTHALASSAFFVGAQGSARAHERRVAALRSLGVPDDRIARLVHPFGLVRHARDPRSLAVGVLAQVLDRARVG